MARHAGRGRACHKNDTPGSPNFHDRPISTVGVTSLSINHPSPLAGIASRTRHGPRDRARWLPAVALLAPSVVFLLAFTYWPILRVIVNPRGRTFCRSPCDRPRQLPAAFRRLALCPRRVDGTMSLTQPGQSCPIRTRLDPGRDRKAAIPSTASQSRDAARRCSSPARRGSAAVDLKPHLIARVGANRLSTWAALRKAGAGSMATTSCPSSFKASGSPTGSR